MSKKKSKAHSKPSPNLVFCLDCLKKSKIFLARRDRRSDERNPSFMKNCSKHEGQRAKERRMQGGERSICCARGRAKNASVIRNCKPMYTNWEYFGNIIVFDVNNYFQNLHSNCFLTYLLLTESRIPGRVLDEVLPKNADRAKHPYFISGKLGHRRLKSHVPSTLWATGIFYVLLFYNIK